MPRRLTKDAPSSEFRDSPGSYGFREKKIQIDRPFPAQLGYGLYESSAQGSRNFNVIISPGMHRSYIYYHKLADWLAKAGGRTYSMDWLGQGNSINDPRSRHTLKGFSMEDHADHFRIFTQEALFERAHLPTYVIGHSWGSLPILKALSESSHHEEAGQNHKPSLLDHLNIQGVCFFTPFFGINDNMRRYKLHHIIDLSGHIPPLKKASLKLRRGGLAHRFLQATLGKDLCDETEIKDPEIRDIDKEFEKKSITVAFLHEARKTQKTLLKRIQDIRFNFPVAIVSAEKETLVCNNSCENWAEIMDAAYMHLEGSKHSDLYDLPDEMQNAPLAKALEWAGLPTPDP